ncbi:MAG: M1 family aminopeptidase [Myxococcota bacterium]
MPSEYGFQGVRSVEQASMRALRRNEFVPADTPEQFPPDVPVDWQDLTLTVEVDVPGRHVRGTATYEGVVRRDELRRIRLDADGIDVPRAFDGAGQRLPLEHDGRTLWIDLGRTAKRGEALRISVDYDTREPRAGFYFILPDADHPDRVAHAWTQGQDEDSRFWFPCHDSPNHKMRLHVLATVSEGMVALSNGVLKDIYRGADPGTRIFDWQIERPIPMYLLTLVVGPFVEVVQQTEPVPVSFHVLPGREADGHRSFDRTPEMIALYERLVGVKFPFEKYGQVAVGEFVFGGMENASLTTQTDLTLHDERAHLDFSSQPLVSHELAHQWFGDLVTCRTWAHGWLNEGFATYFEQLWREHTETVDEFDYARLQAIRGYLREDAGRYRRTIVTNRWREPIDVFDAHLYEKGGAVLHMLRKLLGDQAFFGGVGAYVQAFADGMVETPDLRRALEAFTGVDLGRFFSQWVENGKGHPELKIGGSWDGETREWQLTVEQTQDVKESLLFQFPLEVLFVPESGEPVRRTFAVERKHHSFRIDLPAAPAMVLPDPRGDLLGTVEWTFGEPMLRAALARAPHAHARIQAANALGKRPSTANNDALARALLEDRLWCVQAEVARVLGQIGNTRAFQGLADAVQLPHPKARRAVVAALGRFQTPQAGELLVRLLDQGDPSYFVEAEAAVALGQTRFPGAFQALREALDRPSWNETIRVGVLDGFAALQDSAAIELVTPLLQPHHPTLLRCGAARCLAAFVTEPARVVQALQPYTTDTSFRFVFNVASSLGGLGDARVIPLLQDMSQRATDGRVQRRATESIAQIRAGLGAGKQVDELRKDVEALRNQQRELQDRLDRGEKLRGAVA